MQPEPQITDARHGFSLPSGLTLARVVRQLLQRQREAVIAGLMRGEVGTGHLATVASGMADLLAATLAKYWIEGARDVSRRVSERVGRRGAVLAGLRRSVRHPARGRSRGMGRKAIHDDPFSVFSPQVLEKLRTAVFPFLAELNDSTAEMLREALMFSLSSGEPAKELQRRLLPVFGPGRAATVAMTESSRATHAGGLAAARESGVVVSRTWLASADACPLCLELDGKTVGLNEPYTTEGSGNPAYAVVWYPPRHPRCMCTETHEV